MHWRVCAEVCSGSCHGYLLNFSGFLVYLHWDCKKYVNNVLSHTFLQLVNRKGQGKSLMNDLFKSLKCMVKTI